MCHRYRHTTVLGSFPRVPRRSAANRTDPPTIAELRVADCAMADADVNVALARIAFHYMSLAPHLRYIYSGEARSFWCTSGCAKTVVNL